MMKALILAGALLVAPLAAQAQEFTPYSQMPAGVYQLDPTHASLIWKVSHAGLSNYTARFTDFDASINFNPEILDMSTVTATINPVSVETDYVATPEKDFNETLASSPEWFNAGKFPTITFESSNVQVTGENTGKIIGNLTLLGVTQPLELDVVFNGAYAVQPFSQKPVLGFSATGTLNRSAWGLDTYIPMIGDEVQVIIEGEFVKND